MEKKATFPRYRKWLYGKNMLGALGNLVIQVTEPIKLMIAASLFMILPIGFIAHQIYKDALTPEISTVAGFIVASAGVVFSVAMTLHSQMRDKAFEFLKSSRELPRYYLAGGVVHRKIKQLKELGANKISEDDVLELHHVNGILLTCPTGDDEDSKTKKADAIKCGIAKLTGSKLTVSNFEVYERLRGSIVVTLNLYEEMAIAIKHKEVFEPLLFDYFHTSIEKVHQYYLPFILFMRGEVEDPTFRKNGETENPYAWEHVTWLNERWLSVRNRSEQTYKGHCGAYERYYVELSNMFDKES